MSDVILPGHVDRRLINLSKELDSACEELFKAEREYMDAKTAYEIASAQARMKVKQSAIERGVKVTVQDCDDESLLACRDELTRLNVSEALVKSARANNARLRVQIDIARSVGASVRASMDVG